MTGIFRLTGAEFKKIFKRPSVFIMALILIATIFVSLYLYKPVNATDLTVNYDLSTSIEYYNTFYKEDLVDTEKGINKVFDNADSLIDYHKQNSTRSKNLYFYYNKILTSYEELNEAKFEDKNSKYIEFKNNLENFIVSFDTSLEKLSHFEHIKLTKTNSSYNSTIDTYRKLQNKTQSTDPESALNIIKTNDYLDKLYDEYKNAINFTTPTLLGIAKNLENNFFTFNRLIEKEHSIPSAIESKRLDLVKITEEYSTYFKFLIDNNFPIVTIDNSLKIEITEALDFLTRELNKLTVQGTISDYTKIQNEISNSDVINYLVKVSENNSVKLITFDQTLINDLEKVQNKVNENKASIKENIEEHKNDNSTKNIQTDITEYKLLADSYDKFVNDKIILALSENYKYDEFINLYGDQYKEFNEYQYKENVAINKYYLENNTYKNSFINNFSFGQNSSTETNVFDFMYFVLEICAIVITVFAMMQICNLVTNETESGTITLLLVRPYKRGKILTAKLLTTIFFVITFMLFSSVIAYAGGVALFGFERREIIAVFNGTNAFAISPLLLMLINILSLIIDIIFFVILALMISTILKNYAGSITSCLIVLILHYTLNVLFGGALWYSFMPGLNLHFFRFFGNNYIGAGTNTALATIFNAPIQSSMTILFSGILVISYSIISLLIAYTVFRNRDY